jgi:hypothetical protein
MMRELRAAGTKVPSSSSSVVRRRLETTAGSPLQSRAVGRIGKSVAPRVAERYTFVDRLFASSTVLCTTGSVQKPSMAFQSQRRRQDAFNAKDAEAIADLIANDP